MTPLPQYVQIEPVGQCNLQCRMCPIAYRDEGPAAFLSFETFTRLLDEFEGVRDLHLQGLGEPLMHPRFFDMVRQASGRGIRVTRELQSHPDECAARPAMHQQRPPHAPCLHRRRIAREI